MSQGKTEQPLDSQWLKNYPEGSELHRFYTEFWSPLDFGKSDSKLERLRNTRITRFRD